MPAAAEAQGTDSASFFLHKFAQNIGKETYYRSVSDSGVSYHIKFKFVDRGMAVPLDARLLVTPEDEPLSFWVKGSTSRFSKIYDSVVINGGKAWIRGCVGFAGEGEFADEGVADRSCGRATRCA